MLPTELDPAAAALPATGGGQTCPRFAFAELTCRDAGLWLDYLDRLGFVMTDSVLGPAASTYDLRRGSFRLLITEPGDRHSRHRQVMDHGDYVNEVGLAYAGTAALERVFTSALRAGLRSPSRWAPTLRGTSYFRVLEGPGGVCYSLWDASAGFGAGGGGTEPGVLDHVAYVVPPAGMPQVIRLHECLGLTWHPVPRTELPGGEAMDSGYFSAGSLRITLVTPAGRCQQLDTCLAASGNQAMVQHLALAVPDITAFITTASGQDVIFAPAPPPGYYAALDVPVLPGLQQAGVLADTDEFGVLYQRFLAPASPSSPFFFEAAQRDGAQTFGFGNIARLAESLQQLQAEPAPARG